EGKGTTDQYLEWSDNLTHGIGYSILFHFLSENQPRLIPVGGPEKNTILEALQHMNRVLAEHGQGHGRHHLDMVVRSMWTTSQKYGLLYNSFDLFRFPEGFRLTQNGWSTLTRVK
ncbi:MAG TPA: hypothetical protein VEC17_02365, partial [Candidatus Binatia bacterium]|nr:hypothetical protein [Candidatus Binatia bacterium]